MIAPLPYGKILDHEMENEYVFTPRAAMRAMSGYSSVSGIQSQLLGLLTLLVQVIMVIAHVGGIIREGQGRGSVREDIPDGRSSPFCLHGAFSLIRSRCNAPEEALGEFPALILSYLGDLVTGWERRVVKRWWRDQFARGDRRGLHGGIDVRRLYRTDEEVPVFWYGG